jgi:two-component system chemotaxis response regulator CheY
MGTTFEATWCGRAPQTVCPWRGSKVKGRDRSNFTSSFDAKIASVVLELSRELGSAELSPIMKPNVLKKQIDSRVQSLAVLLVDDSAYMRKIIRNLLMNWGIKAVYEAGDGITALDAISDLAPDVVILDWEMPMLSGADTVRIVRSPGVFPTPDVPIIMLTGHREHWRVVEAMRLGVNEYLVKPVSAQALYDRLVSITALPRPVMQVGDYYGPEPRKPLPGEIVESIELRRIGEY